MQFSKETFIRASPERVFAFHESPDALKLLLPPWEKARIIEAAQISKIGSRAVIEMKVLGIFSVRWVAEHIAYDPPRMFEDIQIKGPFRSWRHRHLVVPCQKGATLRDEIEYDLPLGWLGRQATGMLVVSRLERLFEYRHMVTTKWCEQRE